MAVMVLPRHTDTQDILYLRSTPHIANPLKHTYYLIDTRSSAVTTSPPRLSSLSHHPPAPCDTAPSNCPVTPSSSRRQSVMNYKKLEVIKLCCYLEALPGESKPGESEPGKIDPKRIGHAHVLDLVQRVGEDAEDITQDDIGRQKCAFEFCINMGEEMWYGPPDKLKAEGKVPGWCRIAIDPAEAPVNQKAKPLDEPTDAHIISGLAHYKEKRDHDHEKMTVIQARRDFVLE